jgi:hypothetical protein
LYIELEAGLDDGAEALLLNGQPVDGGAKVGDYVNPVLVGGGNDREIRFKIGDGTRGTDDHGVGGIANPAGNAGAFCLCGGNDRGKQ